MNQNNAKKLKRMDLNVEAHGSGQCKCEALQENVKKMFEEMKETIKLESGVLLQAVKEENEVLRYQLQIAVETISDVKVIMHQLQRQQAEELPGHIEFPVENEDQLLLMEEEINEANRAIYIKSMKSVLNSAGVIKNLKFVLSDAVMQDYNVDGVHGKKSLKNLKNFFSALLDSITITDDSGPAEKQLRKAIQLQKNRVIKARSVSKKTSANVDNIKIEQDGT